MSKENNYELWQVINETGKYIPLILIDVYEDFSTAYINYLEKMKNVYCVIICNK